MYGMPVAVVLTSLDEIKIYPTDSTPSRCDIWFFIYISFSSQKEPSYLYSKSPSAPATPHALSGCLINDHVFPLTISQFFEMQHSEWSPPIRRHFHGEWHLFAIPDVCECVCVFKSLNYKFKGEGWEYISVSPEKLLLDLSKKNLGTGSIEIYSVFSITRGFYWTRQPSS